jgi:hypothetical protein
LQVSHAMGIEKIGIRMECTADDILAHKEKPFFVCGGVSVLVLLCPLFKGSVRISSSAGVLVAVCPASGLRDTLRSVVA